MPDRRSPRAARLLVRRTRARSALLASAAVTVAVAVGTVGVVLAWLARAVAEAGVPPPPGVDPEEVAAQAAAGAAALATASPALVLLVALVAGTAVSQLAQLVAAAREHETTTIRARGFSRRQGWGTDAGEAVAVAVVGGAVGAGLALAVAAALGIPLPLAAASWPWLLATALALAAIFAVSLRRGEGARTASRAARATTAALVVVVLLAAGLVVWQLPLARGRGFDPIVAVAPAVVLLAAALVALAVFGAIALAWARPAAAAPGLQPGYPARQVARRIPIYAVAVLLVGLTAAQAVFASAYDATWRSMTADSAAVRSGAELRVDMAPQSASPGDVAAAAAVPGVDAASAALIEDVEVGETDAQLVAVPADRISDVVSDAGGLVDRAALTDAAATAGTVSSAPLPLGDTATGLRVSVLVTGSGGGGVPEVVLGTVLVDALGTPVTVTLDTGFAVNEDGTVALVGETALPDGVAPWSVLGVTASLAPAVVNRSATVAVTAVEAVGGAPLEIAGSVELGDGTTDAVLWVAESGTAGPGDAPPPVGAVVSAELAARLGVTAGDPLEFRYAGSGRRGEAVIASVVDAVPGAAGPLSLFVPYDALLASQLQRGTSVVAPDAVWAAGASSADEALSAALGDRPVATTEPGVTARVVGALVPGWWIAVAGSILLALVAAVAIAQTLALARRRELGVLRALGVTGRGQGRMRAAELAGVFGLALALGTVAGAVASWLIAPALVRATTPGILPLAGGVAFDGVTLAIAVGGLAAGLAVVVAVAATQVTRAGRAATVGEDAR